MAASKNIILTGASRGIGLAIARFLLQAQHNVFLVARTKEPLEKLKKEYPGQVEFLAADLADFDVCESLTLAWFVVCEFGINARERMGLSKLEKTSGIATQVRET